MKTVQFYKYAAAILLLLNIVLIAFFFITKPKGNMGKPPLRAMETLGLDEAQHDLFLASAKRHSIEMTSINEAQKKLLMPYFNQLKHQANHQFRQHLSRGPTTRTPQNRTNLPAFF